MFKTKLFVFYAGGKNVKKGDLSDATQIDTAYTIKEAKANGEFLKECYPDGCWFEFADSNAIGSETPKIRLDI